MIPVLLGAGERAGEPLPEVGVVAVRFVGEVLVGTEALATLRVVGRRPILLAAEGGEVALWLFGDGCETCWNPIIISKQI